MTGTNTFVFGLQDGRTNNYTVGPEWTRISYTGTPPSTARGLQIYSTNQNFTYYIWGAQLENRGYATQYIESTDTNGVRGTTVATGGGWADRSGNSNHGELVNGPIFDNSNLGSINFDGTDDAVEIPNFPLIFSGSVCMEGWFYFNNDSRGILFGNFDTANAINFEKHTSRRLRIYWNGGSPDTFTGNNVVDLNKWHHIIIQRNVSANEMQFFVDSASVLNSGNIGSNVTSTGTTFRIGRDSRTGTTTLDGRISNVKVYNRALSPQEIAQNYNATRARYNL